MSEQDNKAQSEEQARERISDLRKIELSINQWVESLLTGDRLSLAKGITLLESTRIEDHEKSTLLLNALLPHTGKSWRIGITGVPGVGKSTLIEQLGLNFIQNGHKVAVLAIDPSSRLSAGSILGDKTRMNELAVNDSAFIRPSPASDSLGGVARMTRESMMLCEAAGYDIIIVETVGVGQSETEVHDMVDTFLLLMLAGAGDELQGIKRGIMEMADVIAVTKADTENLQRAQQARTSISSAIHLFAGNEEQWVVPVITCSTVNEDGINELLHKVESHRIHIESAGFKTERRKKQNLFWFKKSLEEQIIHDILNKEDLINEIEQQKIAILQNKISPFTAANELVKRIKIKYFN